MNLMLINFTGTFIYPYTSNTCIVFLFLKTREINQTKSEINAGEKKKERRYKSTVNAEHNFKFLPNVFL
jgi:hypothetical protein